MRAKEFEASESIAWDITQYLKQGYRYFKVWGDHDKRVEFDGIIPIVTGMTLELNKTKLCSVNSSFAMACVQNDFKTPNSKVQGDWCYNATIRDADIDCTTACKDMIRLYGFGRGILKNIWCYKSAEPAQGSGRAFIAILAGNPVTSGAPGGCHQSSISDIHCIGDDNLNMHGGIMLAPIGDRKTNANCLSNINIARTNEYGVKIIDGRTNRINGATLEKIGGRNHDQGIGVQVLGSKSKKNYLIGGHFEWLETDYTDDETKLIVV